MLNTRDKNKTESYKLSSGDRKGYICNGPEVESFLEVPVMSIIGGTVQARKRAVCGELQHIVKQVRENISGHCKDTVSEIRRYERKRIKRIKHFFG